MTVSFGSPPIRFSGATHSTPSHPYAQGSTASAASTVSSFASLNDAYLEPLEWDSIELRTAKHTVKTHKVVAKQKEQAELQVAYIEQTQQKGKSQDNSLNEEARSRLSKVDKRYNDSKNMTKARLKALKQAEDPASTETASNFFKKILLQRWHQGPPDENP